MYKDIIYNIKIYNQYLHVYPNTKDMSCIVSPRIISVLSVIHIKLGSVQLTRIYLLQVISTIVSLKGAI